MFQFASHVWSNTCKPSQHALNAKLLYMKLHLFSTLGKYVCNTSLVVQIQLYLYIKALASARGSEKKKKRKKIRKKIKKIVPVPIYVFVDSEQKAEFKAKIKPCSHQLNCMKFLL